jgi:hypothetical protein
MSLPAVARDRGDSSISITLGTAVFGYSDGYYDSDRGWHDWRNEEERDWYRQNHNGTYYDMDRERDRDAYRRDWREGRRADWRGGDGGERGDDDSDFSVSLNGAVFGYSDGYYDNDRRWHGWRNDDERSWYQRNRGPTYYQIGRNDDRDNDRREWLEGRRNDWRGSGRDDVDFSISLGEAVFGYSDGYYDNRRRWHDWRSDDERRWYERNRRPTYYEMGRYQDRDRYRRDWRDGRRDDWRDGRNDFTISLRNVVFGYYDGYYDNGRRWHRWRNVSERNWYRQHYRHSYYHIYRHRDRDRYRRDWRDGRRNDWRASN